MDQPAYEQVFTRCVQIIGAAKQLPSDAIQPDSTFDSLGIDSLDKINLSFEIEESFQINIPDQALSRIRTIDDMVRGIQQLAADRRLEANETAE